MPQKRLPKQTLHPKVNAKKPVGQTQTKSPYYNEDLSWNHLGLRQSKMQYVLMDL